MFAIPLGISCTLGKFRGLQVLLTFKRWHTLEVLGRLILMTYGNLGRLTLGLGFGIWKDLVAP